MLTVKKTAAKFKVTPACVLRWIKNGTILFTRVGHEYLLPDNCKRPPKMKPGPLRAGVPR